MSLRHIALRPRSRRPLSLLVVACLLVAGCGDAAAGEERLVVSAAASLTDVFAAVADAFEQAHPGVDVVLNLGGSSALREQILEGAAVDVFASADAATMEAVATAGATVGLPAVFATNRMVIAVPAGNPGGVTGLADLANTDLFVGVCAAGVPCGEFAQRVLDNAGVTASIDTEEGDVRALLTKIGAGELDAGIVYATDAGGSSGTVAIELPAEVNVVAEYPIAVLRDAPRPQLAAAFVDFVLSPAGRALLVEHGFVTP